jgi:hypothetical protein
MNKPASKSRIKKAIDRFFTEDKTEAVIEIMELVPGITEAQLETIEKKYK